SPSGVTDHILEKAQPIKRFRVMDGGKLLMSLDTSRIPGQFGAICAFPQGMMERLLVKRLGDYGFLPEWNVKLQAVSGNPDRPQAPLLHPEGPVETVAPDILMAADGSRSAVRQALGFAFPGESLESSFYLADFRYAGPLGMDFAEVLLLDPGLIGRLPV